MVKHIAAFLVLLYAGLWCLQQAPSRAAGWLPLAKGAGGVAYTGPGDIVASAYAWWGLRAYSSADRGNKLLNVCNSTGGVDVGCADMFSDATTGNLVSATISSITCPGTNCTVKTAYDRSGSANCTTACDATQVTVASRPTLVANCIGSLPCMTCNGSQSLASATNNTQAQPFTISGVGERTGATSAFGDILGFAGGGVQFLFNSSINQFAIYAGTVAPATANDTVFHALQGIYNAASSTLYIDGVSNSVTAGTNAIAAVGINICDGNNKLTGNVAEVGIWPIGFSTGNQSSMDLNQRAYWGF